MKKGLLFVKLLVLSVVFSANAQIDFEGLLHDYENGQHFANGFYQTGNYKFVNYYNAAWDSWSGFAISKMTDTQTPGYTNQYSAIAGSGYQFSSNYMVSFVSSWDGADYLKLDTAKTLSGFYVTNSTYAYLSMQNGDAYAKKFGGDTGDDPDWFLLTVKGYNNGSFTDSVNFYLADYRFSDNSQDYIVADWAFVDLSALSMVDSLVFSLSSSDNGSYGMNTPAYFCMDNLTSSDNQVVDFEDYDFDYWNGSDLSGGFRSGAAYFYNSYNEAWGAWSGFAYSRKTDTQTAGYTNQYSAITGGGHNSETYAVSYSTSGVKFDSVYAVSSIYVTNSTYAYLSMQNGDAFAKKFGGDTGDDPDWFLLTIKGYNNGVFTDSVNFYLADYRFDDNSQDYIINEWTEVQLSSLGNIDSLSFSLNSSDVGQWGMNTPAYFCMDDIQLMITSVDNNFAQNINKVSIYPNPAKDLINIKNVENSEINIYSVAGKKVYSAVSLQNLKSVDVSGLKAGVYIVSVKSDSNIQTYKFIKQ